MLNTLLIAVRIASVAALAYGAWLVFTNHDLWRNDERDPRQHPRDPKHT